MAFVIMKGFGVGSLAVVDAGAYVGMVSWYALVDLEPNAPIGGVVQRDAPVLTPDSSVRDAAELLASARVERLPVVNGGELVGLVSPRELLPVLGRSADPLTDLPWSDTLREWAVSKLRSGREISIVFFDLDGFGLFNKKSGHLIGDQVLRMVADVLRSGVDPELDTLCRYGGDEFAMASIRAREGAEALASRLARDVATVTLPASDARVRTSWGVCGGKRTREREDVHFAATLDNLINLASRQCQAMKDRKATLNEEAAAVAVPVGEVISLRSLNISVDGERSTVSVELLAAGLHVSASLSATGAEAQTLMVVAQAVADAISHALPKDTTLVVHDCTIESGAEAGEFAHVLATLYTPTHMKELRGSHLVQGDKPRAVAMAMIRASEGDVADLGGGPDAG
jgi:diguanylate cyclase (GGDEF)-like protein